MTADNDDLKQAFHDLKASVSTELDTSMGTLGVALHALTDAVTLLGESIRSGLGDVSARLARLER